MQGTGMYRVIAQPLVCHAGLDGQGGMGNRAYQDLLDLLESHQGTAGCEKCTRQCTRSHKRSTSSLSQAWSRQLDIWRFCKVEAQARLQVAFGSKQSTGTGSKIFSMPLRSNCGAANFSIVRAGPGQKAVCPEDQYYCMHGWIVRAQFAALALSLKL
jgi:hypothetical protein